jgi:hypothetical protein
VRSRRQAFVLIHILGAIILATTALYLTGKTVLSLFHAQHAMADRSSEYAVINDLLDQLRSDTRSASSMTIRRDGDSTTVELPGANETVSYTFGDGVVERSPRSAWDLDHAEISVSGGERTLEVSIVWRSPTRRKRQPTRRFDMTYWIGRGYLR